MDPDQYVFSEQGVSGKVQWSQRATPDELVDLANRIWREVRDVEPDGAGDQKLLADMQAKYRDFTVSFPLVLRWMVQMREFKVKAFRRFLDEYARTKPKDRREFLELQASYLVHLRERPHQPVQELRDYKKQVVDALVKEDEEFTKMQKDAEAEVQRLKSEDNHALCEDLYVYLMAQKAARESEMTCRGSEMTCRGSGVARVEPSPARP